MDALILAGGATPPDFLAALPERDRHPDRAVLATRVSAEAQALVRAELPGAEVHEVARAVTLGPLPEPRGRVAVISAGTSDAPVAAEAALATVLAPTPAR